MTLAPLRRPISILRPFPDGGAAGGLVGLEMRCPKASFQSVLDRS